MTDDRIRLQKYLSECAVASRRKSEELISQGRVKVNGKKITEQGVKIEIGADNVSVDDKPIKLKNKKYYIMLNKPVGYVSTAKDQFDRPTVVDLIKEDLGDVRIFPVGRLDYETEGLLLLTNDGVLSHNLLSPAPVPGLYPLPEPVFLPVTVSVPQHNRIFQVRLLHIVCP